MGVVELRGPVLTDWLAWRLVWMSLAIAVLTVCPAVVGAGEPAATESEPLVMEAERVRYWDLRGERWVLLEGRAQVHRGAERVLSADRAVARVSPSAGETPPSAVVEIYAEGEARAGNPNERPCDTLRLQEATRQAIRLKSLSEKTGVSRLEAAPEGVEVLARGFPPERPKVEAPKAVEETPLAVLEPPQEFDPEVKPAQFYDDEPMMPAAPALEGEAPSVPGAIEDAESPAPLEGLPPYDRLPPTDAVPLPGEEVPAPPARRRAPEPVNPDVILPMSKRVISITPRYGTPFQPTYRQNKDGSVTIVVRGGVQIVSEQKRTDRAEDEPETYRVDLAADSAVIWIGPRPGEKSSGSLNLGGVASEQDANQPMEVYLEGDVIVRQDELTLAGQNDQRIIRTKQAYYDFRTHRLVGNEGEFDYFAPGLVAPLKTTGERIDQYSDVLGVNRDGTFRLGPTHVMIDKTMTTGSRFPKPGYRFTSGSVDITQIEKPMTDPFSGTLLRLRGQPIPMEKVWELDARQNTYFIGPVPFWYWPRIVMTDDFDPPLRNFAYRYGSYFGHQVLLDFSMFKLLGQRKPAWIDTWNLDVDYLSMRGPALGTELGWFGRDFFGDLTDPYGKRRKGRTNTVDRPYFGYFDAWGIHDTGYDVLGSHPAVVTYGPPWAGKHGYDRSKVPPFQNWRGRVMLRHMQSFLPEDAPEEDDLRLQIEAGGYSDRHFLEEYYKRLFDSGLDQDTLAYGIWQHRNQAATLTTQANIMPWITDTQWLPKAEYYRFGDNLLDDGFGGDLFSGRFSYSQNTGADYANVHTAVEVNNPNIFNFMPYDPISNTSGPWQSGRYWTTQELQMPMDFSVFRIVPYAQGQLMGWDNQIGGVPIGRAWGAAGAKFNFMLYKTWSEREVESELFNVHGMAHKVNFDADYRTAYSNVNLNRIGIQSQYDDDTYEFVRRYFALDNYVGGVLPPMYDPRLLVLRRTLDPTVFTPDIQGNMMTLQLGIHQRLQTKRGPKGKRRIVDYMILDVQTTYFPDEMQNNFGRSFGQNFYNFEWFIGDRTSIVSTGWFEFWKIAGNNRFTTYDPGSTNSLFGLNVVTAGISINRPPRGSVYFGYSIVNSGSIATSALNVSYNYWLSPKWYTSFATSYDFGNQVALGTTASITKIGADFLTSVGITYDPQRSNFTFGLELAPRFSPNVRLGSAVGSRFDSRFAPDQ